LSWIAAVAVLLASTGAGRVAEPDPELGAAEKVLRQAKVGTDGPSLLAFLRQRTLSPADRAKLAAHIEQFGDDDFQVRKKATAALLKAGRAALPLLRRAERNEDTEIARRAKECVQQLEQGSEDLLVTAVARVLADRRPKGAAKAILAYLPMVDEEGLEES